MINIAIIEMNELFRSSFKSLIEKNNDWNVLFDIDGSKEKTTVFSLSTLRPEIIFLGMQQYNLADTLSAIKDLSQVFFPTKIIVLSNNYQEHLIMEVLHSGAWAFVTKNTSYKTLLVIADAVLNNRKVVEVMNQKENAHYAPIVAHLDRECNYSKITQRQQLFLCLCATDLTYKEIAGRMEISTKTADRYRDGLFHKLNVKSKVGLALFAVKNGMAIW